MHLEGKVHIMFNKNLQYINNEALKRRLEKISDIESRNGITYCVTPSNDYVLLKDDVPSDDLVNPRDAIRKMLANNIKQEMKPNDIIITFGIGLGYLLDETFNKYPSRIFIYEPDLPLLRFVLSNVDMSEHFASGRVYITNDLEELIKHLEETFITKDKVEVVFLQNYAVVRNKDLLMLTQRVYEACKSKIVDVNTITKFSKQWLENALNNLALFKNREMYKLSDLYGKYKGQTAIIAGAGPSLADNIGNIQANRNKYIIFAVNKAVKFLLLNGITPDYVVALDAKNMDKTLGGLEEKLGRVNCIADLRTDTAVFSKGFRRYFVSFSNADIISKKLAEYNDFIQFNETGGTASTLGLISAIKMGFSKIVLAGIDLAFKDNVAYASGEGIVRVSQDELDAEGINKKLVQVKSVTGGNVYTRDDYQAYVTQFGEIIKDMDYKEIYNISSFGAAIEGVKNVRFDDLYLFAPAVQVSLDNLEPFKLELNALVQEEFGNINNVISLLSKGAFSPALVSAIVKSALLYQYMQGDIVNALQRNLDSSLAESFIAETKIAIKNVVEMLQKGQFV